MLNETVDFWIVFPSFESERFDMSHLNVNCSRDFSDQVLTVETTNEMPASLDLLLPPGFGRGAEDKRVCHEHRFGQQPDWRRGRQGLVCGGLRRIAEYWGMS